MNKKQLIGLSVIFVLAMSLVLLTLYLQARRIDEERRRSDAELRKLLLDRLQFIDFKLQQQEDPGILAAAKQALQRAEASGVQQAELFTIESGRVKLNPAADVNDRDTYFGVSLRNGHAIANHAMRTPSSYNGELPHPLADRFVLLQYRRMDFEQNGRTVSGPKLVACCSAVLIPVDKTN